MKFPIILLLVLIFVNSKIEIKSFFKQSLKTFYESDEYEDDDERIDCHYDGEKEDTKDQCIARGLSGNSEVCCFGTIEATSEDSTQTKKECSEFPKIITYYSDLLKLPGSKAMIKEVAGFNMYSSEDVGDDIFSGLPEDSNINIDLQCPNKFSFNMDLQPYTEEEKKILNSTDYCLYPIVSAMNNQEEGDDDGNINIDTKSECKNLRLLPSSEGTLECGYFSIKMKMEMEGYSQTQSIKSCTYFNSEVNKKLFSSDIMSKMDAAMKQQMGDIPEGASYSISIELKNAKGEKYSHTFSNSYWIAFSKFLFLFIFILF